MHELAVTESILEIALRHARQHEATQITALHLVIGQLSSIIDDSVQFYWDLIAKDTPAEGARLVFTRIPIELECRSCQAQYSPSSDDLACPKCGSLKIKVLKGEEFFLESIEIETHPAKEKP